MLKKVSCLPSKKFKEHNKYTYCVKISANNYDYDKESKILTIPLYMFFAYLNDLKERNSSTKSASSVEL